jgi:transposase
LASRLRPKIIAISGRKGYHSRDVLKDLDDSPWKTRIAEPRPSKGYLRWHGDDEARAAVYANRKRLRSGVGKEAMRKRGEVAERSFAHVLERGGLRRTWLRGRKNVYKRYLVHISSYNLGILMRALFGAGTPKEAAVIRTAFLFVIQTAEAITVAIIAVFEADVAALIIAVAPDVA